MADEEQECFKGYLDLENYIEDLQAGRPARLPVDLTPELAQIYRMAALFHSATPDVAEPRSAFVSDLAHRLQAWGADQMLAQTPYASGSPQSGLQDEDEGLLFDEPTARLVDPRSYRANPEASSLSLEPDGAVQNNALPPAESGSKKRKTSKGRNKKPIVSRRSLFAGGAVAAASLAAGLGGGMFIARQVSTPPPQWPKLVDNVPVSWHLVAPVAEITDAAIKFVTESVVGYIIRDDEDHRDRIIAFSAACTHMGCIVQWNQKTRQFDCPCHSGRFDEYGRPDPTSPIHYLRSLPRLDTRIENGNVYVAVPTTTTQ